MKPVVRESTKQDLADLEVLYPAAFPDEALLPLVRSLLADPAIALSLVATIDDRVVGHAMLTVCGLAGSSLGAALLGPVGVAPEVQGQGIGSLLIEAGLQRMRDAGTDVALVLGDPAYYHRFGFTPSSRVWPPYAMPPEWQDAWQILPLHEGPLPELTDLTVPHQWDDPALWLP